MPTAGIIELDVHGKNQYQTRIAVEAVLRRAGKGTYRIRIIHGHNHGTALRDMIRTEFAAHPKVQRIITGLNDGITELVLRELF